MLPKKLNVIADVMGIEDGMLSYTWSTVVNANELFIFGNKCLKNWFQPVDVEVCFLHGCDIL